MGLGVIKMSVSMTSIDMMRTGLKLQRLARQKNKEIKQLKKPAKKFLYKNKLSPDDKIKYTI